MSKHCLNASKGCVMWGFGGVKQCNCSCDVCMTPFVNDPIDIGDARTITIKKDDKLTAEYVGDELIIYVPEGTTSEQIKAVVEEARKRG